jgi:hypothetical protein
MGKQFNIRSDMAYELATEMAAIHGKPIARIVEEALTAYRAQEIEERRKRWDAALAHDRALLRQSTSNFEIEDLYDSETGFPA